MVSVREDRTMSDKMLKFVNTDKEMPETVSYTHLTLPTIDRV